MIPPGWCFVFKARCRILAVQTVSTLGWRLFSLFQALLGCQLLSPISIFTSCLLLFYYPLWSRLFPVHAAFNANTLITLVPLCLWPRENFRCGSNGVLGTISPYLVTKRDHQKRSQWRISRP